MKKVVSGRTSWISYSTISYSFRIVMIDKISSVPALAIPSLIGYQPYSSPSTVMSYSSWGIQLKTATPNSDVWGKLVDPRFQRPALTI